MNLASGNAAIGRTEKSALGCAGRRRLALIEGCCCQLGIALGYILHISLGGVAPSFHMVEGMVAYGMAFSFYALKYMGVFAHVIAYAKEGSLDLKGLEGIEDKLGRAWHGAIVEGKVDRFPHRWYSPRKCGIKKGKKKRGAKEIHTI